MGKIIKVQNKHDEGVVKLNTITPEELEIKSDVLRIDIENIEIGSLIKIHESKVFVLKMFNVKISDDLELSESEIKERLFIQKVEIENDLILSGSVSLFGKLAMSRVTVEGDVCVMELRRDAICAEQGKKLQLKAPWNIKAILYHFSRKVYEAKGNDEVSDKYFLAEMRAKRQSRVEAARKEGTLEYLVARAVSGLE